MLIVLSLFVGTTIVQKIEVKTWKTQQMPQVTIYCGRKVITILLVLSTLLHNILVETHFFHHFGFLSTIIDVFHGYSYYLANTCEKERKTIVFFMKRKLCVSNCENEIKIN
jgi:uncharacterized protein YacL